MLRKVISEVVRLTETALCPNQRDSRSFPAHSNGKKKKQRLFSCVICTLLVLCICSVLLLFIALPLREALHSQASLRTPTPQASIPVHAVGGQGSLYTGAVPTIILKLPRSGSSWFTQQLNAFPPVFISKEIIQSGDVGLFSSVEKQKHLQRALQKPTGKLSASRSFFHDGRFIEDYLLHKSLKIAFKMKVLGFTLNPEHARDVDWSEILRPFHGVRLIIFARSNIVKTAVSGIRGTQMKKYCGQANQRAGSEKCSIPTHLNITMEALIEDIDRWQSRNQFLMEYPSTNPALSALPTMTVFYEELQSNSTLTMQRLMKFLLNKEHSTSVNMEDDLFFPVEEASIIGNALLPQHGAGWVKRTTDNLRDHLLSFDGIDKKLNGIASCHSIRQQLNEKQPHVYRSIPRDEWKICMDSIINKQGTES